MGEETRSDYPVDAGTRLRSAGKRSRLTARLWQAFALLCVGIGMVGVVVPLLPTTIFILLAAWASARGSPALQHWLETHPRFGPPLLDWREHHAIRPRAKRAAVMLIAASWLLTLASVELPFARTAATAVLLAVTAYIVTRPDGPESGRKTSHD